MRPTCYAIRPARRRERDNGAQRRPWRCCETPALTVKDKVRSIKMGTDTLGGHAHPTPVARRRAAGRLLPRLIVCAFRSYQWLSPPETVPTLARMTPTRFGNASIEEAWSAILIHCPLWDMHPGAYISSQTRPYWSSHPICGDPYTLPPSVLSEPSIFRPSLFGALPLMVGSVYSLFGHNSQTSDQGCNKPGRRLHSHAKLSHVPQRQPRSSSNLGS